jgi:DNA-binding transcriptional regulator YhcF (GntR family)
LRGINNAVRVLVEHLEEVPVTRQKLSKNHGVLLNTTSQIFDSFVNSGSLTAQRPKNATTKPQAMTSSIPLI